VVSDIFASREMPFLSLPLIITKSNEAKRRKKAEQSWDWSE